MQYKLVVTSAAVTSNLSTISSHELGRVLHPDQAAKKLEKISQAQIDGLQSWINNSAMTDGKVGGDAWNVFRTKVKTGKVILVDLKKQNDFKPAFIYENNQWHLANPSPDSSNTLTQFLNKIPATSAQANSPTTPGGAAGASKEKAKNSKPLATEPAATHQPNAVKAFEGGQGTAGSQGNGAAQKNATTTPAANGTSTEKVCTGGEPINMASGEELLSLTDFVLPGPIPFEWKRIYRSNQLGKSALGIGWLHPGVSSIAAKDKTVELIDDEGRTIIFLRTAIGETSRQLHENMTLKLETATRYILKQAGKPTRVFEATRDGRFRLTQIWHKAFVAGDFQRGYMLQFRYDTANRLVTIEGNWGKGLSFDYSEANRITAIYQLDHAGDRLKPALMTYEYDQHHDLIAARNAAGHGEKYRYQNHVILQRTTPLGFNFTFEWDELTPNAKCLRQYGDNDQYQYTFTWNPAQQRSSVTDSFGHTLAYKYNQFGLMDEIIDHEGNVTRNEYNAAGQLISVTDPLGAKTKYIYDDKQRLLRVEDALKQRTDVLYDGDEITAVIDALGQQWKREVNSRGLTTALIDPTGAITRYAYTTQGLVSQIIDPQGHVTKIEWDQFAQLKHEIDPLGNVTRYEYDDWGRITRVIAHAVHETPEQAESNAVKYTYTPNNLIESVTTALGQSRFDYNPNNFLIKYTDPQGRVTQYRYDDKLNQPTERTDPLGNILRYEYDAERNLTALINENGDTYQFFYDSQKRLIKEIGFDGRTQHYKYDAAGQLIQHLDSGEVVTTFERDVLGRLTTKHSRLVSDDIKVIQERCRYQYDALGRLTETYNPHQFLQFKYDARGLILNESHMAIGANGKANVDSKVSIAHQYNTLGQRIATQLPDGQKIDYDYDTSLGFSAVKWNGRVVTQVRRDKLGREIGRDQGELTTTTDYDLQGRLLKQIAWHQTTSEQPIQREYGYDPAGNLNFIRDGGEETKYVYDALNRLKLTANASPEFFDFDPAGNLLSISSSPSNAPGLVKGNRLLIQGDKHFDYDARGNLIRESRGKDGVLQSQYRYNLNNQLIEVLSNQHANHVQFKYDPLGRRIEKTDAFGTTNFLWADNLLMQESRKHIKKTYINEPGSFRPLAQVQDEQIYHYHLDHLGTPKELTNEAGKIVWKAKYQTYGNVALKDIEEIENNLRFQGQYFDTETGLHYNRFRYYNPSSGQFINQDPIGLMGGLNNYQYVPNPISWIDPFGLQHDDQGANVENSVIVKPAKWDYFFGRVKSNPHNEARSLQNLKDLNTLGFDETAGGQEALTKIFQQSKDLPEISRHITDYGVTVTRTAKIGEVGSIDIKYFYPKGNMSAVPEVSTIIPKIFKL